MKSYSNHKTYTANGTHETGKRNEYVTVREHNGFALFIFLAPTIAVIAYVIMQFGG